MYFFVQHHCIIKYQYYQYQYYNNKNNKNTKNNNNNNDTPLPHNCQTETYCKLSTDI